MLRLTRLTLAISCTLAAGTAIAEPAGTTRLPVVEVTTSKTMESATTAPIGISVLTGEELRARGAIDLRSALSGIAGVESAQGSDGGPASAVPGFWGLKEFDAFLLIVDGTPWGGAFTPALASLDLNNIERIEVVRGAAPVSYGATSFVGVIHVIHYAAGKGPRTATVGIGSRGSWRVSAGLPLDDEAGFAQSLNFNAEKHDLEPDRSGYDRAHLLYRAAGDAADGHWTADLDFTRLNQDPASPHPREGRLLSVRVPLDANHNPTDAKIDERRGQLALGWTTNTAWGEWDTRFALARSLIDNTRGFLRGDFSDGDTNNADGFRQDRSTTELYFDTHLVTALSEHSKLVWGLDHQYGKGDQSSENFEYAVALDGHNAPSSRGITIDEETQLDDKRNFTGIYGQWLVDPTERLHFDAGLRINHTSEKRHGTEVVNEDDSVSSGSDDRSQTRLSGAVGASFRAWEDGKDQLVAYANYRNTFKPAVIDFGPEAESEILKAEKASSGEVGLRGKNFEGALEWDLSMFYMDFSNLVVPSIVNGSPGLTNAGDQHYTGAELEARYHFNDDFSISGNWAFHDVRFGDYVRLFGSNLMQLKGNAQELSPQHLAGLGFLYAPAGQGIFAHGDFNYIGKRWLNARNTAPAESYNTFDAGIGYNAGFWQVRVDGYNLSNRRDPVAESELGDAQYYRLAGREYWATATFTF